LGNRRRADDCATACAAVNIDEIGEPCEKKKRRDGQASASASPVDSHPHRNFLGGKAMKQQSNTKKESLGQYRIEEKGS
jgi:hypothetical protein